jgi:hypothetical protein
MTARTYIGGGNNQASNPLDWSPTGVPQPGDALEAAVGSNLTMNVSGNALAGDSFNAAGISITANLTHHAVMSASLMFGGSTTFNVSQQSTLTFGDSRAPGHNQPIAKLHTSCHLHRSCVSLDHQHLG